MYTYDDAYPMTGGPMPESLICTRIEMLLHLSISFDLFFYYVIRPLRSPLPAACQDYLRNVNICWHVTALIHTHHTRYSQHEIRYDEWRNRSRRKHTHHANGLPYRQTNHDGSPRCDQEHSVRTNEAQHIPAAVVWITGGRTDCRRAQFNRRFRWTVGTVCIYSHFR